MLWHSFRKDLAWLQTTKVAKHPKKELCWVPAMDVQTKCTASAGRPTTQLGYNICFNKIKPPYVFFLKADEYLGQLGIAA